MAVHAVSGLVGSPAVFAGVLPDPGKVFVLNMLSQIAPVLADVAAQGAGQLCPRLPDVIIEPDLT